MVRFLISVPETLHQSLKNIAGPQGQTLNALIRQILWEWIEKNETSA